MKFIVATVACLAVTLNARALPPGLEPATAAAQAGRWADALPLWEAASDKYPDDPDVTAQLGLAELNTGHSQDARRTFNRALRLAPDNLPAQIGLVQLAISERRFDDAVAAATKTARTHPDSADAYRSLGEAQKAASRRSEAETAFRRAVALGPADWRNHAALADAVLMRNKADEAIKEYREAVRLRPDDGSLKEALGKADMAGARYGEAARAYLDAMDLARRPTPDWARIDSLALVAIDALSKGAAALRDGYETREAVFDANTRALEVADALLADPAVADADPAGNMAMAQRASAYALMGQAAASDLAAMRKTTGSDAADAAVFREQARRAVVSARAATKPGGVSA